MNIENSFLIKIGMEARKPRVSYWNDIDTVSIRITETTEWKDAGLWFRTAGCSYDANGGCLMCDYSNGPQTDSDQMVSYITQGLKKIPPDCRMLLISPSGSMLDSNEVPRDALKRILELLSDTPYPRIMFETRAETVSEKVIQLCKSILGNRFYGLCVGLESVSPFILKHCINKQLHLGTVVDAFRICKTNGVFIFANVLVGAPFLSSSESVQTVVETVQWALDQGACQCDLFPIHVKRYTPLATLYDTGLYKPPSFWMLAEVLNLLGKEKWPQVGLSWYTSYGAYNVVASPTTCPVCESEVLACLTGYAQTHEPSFVQRMNEITCSCKDEWKQKADKPMMTLPERVVRGYRAMAVNFFGTEWWNVHSDKIGNIIHTDWKEGGGQIAVQKID